jgi:alpha-beta hydrolase superfamily lysophospholipase
MSRRRWPDPPPEPEGFSREVVTSDTDADLAVYSAPARGAGRGTVCILHDLAEHAARYAPMALALAARGVHVYAHDHRGHGATRADESPWGVFATRNGFDLALRDALFVSERARAAHPRLPLVLFGQGFGGVLALNQAFAKPASIDGVAVWNADIATRRVSEIRELVRRTAWLGGDRGGRRVWRRVTDVCRRRFSPARTPVDWLSRDPHETDRYMGDPLCGWGPSILLWRDVATGTERTCEDANFRHVPRATPFHLLGGSDDPVTDGGSSVVSLDERLRDMGFTDVSRVIIGGARHDTLHDLGREEALELLLHWIGHVATRSHL